MRSAMQGDEPADWRLLSRLLLSLAALSLSCGGAGVRRGGDCTGDDCASGAETEVQPLAGSAAALIPRFPVSGSIAVTLHPGPEAEVGAPTVVSFGAPFPPGTLKSADELRAFDRNGEIALHARAILPWRVWPGRGIDESVRAALVSVEVVFSSRAPVAITLVYGSRPRATLLEPADPRADWVEVADTDYPGLRLPEPRVYATFTPSWLGSCLLRTRTTPVGDEDWAWFDKAVVAFARTAVNDVPEEVTSRIPYATDHEPWLFDRTATLFGVYVRTGDAKWLRRAHRAAQFYLQHVSPRGHFDLKDPDMKYGYGRSLLMDFQLTGDPALLAGIERIAKVAGEWNPVYGPDTGFWTERHQTYALLGALSAWEASGAKRHAARARAVADASFAMATSAGAEKEGCMLHTMDAHEGSGGPDPVCSPWMSALFADALWEYYIHSQDEKALTLLASLGHFVAERGLYSGGKSFDHTVPWYLASSLKTFSDGGASDDIEHNCDVAGLVARAAWAEKQLGRDPSALRKTAAVLLDGCSFVLASWHRPQGVASGQSEWRLSPPRKFNWWFGTTSDLPWLMDATSRK